MGDTQTINHVKYKILKQLGRGSYAVVWEAQVEEIGEGASRKVNENLQVHEKVAIKLMNGENTTCAMEEQYAESEMAIAMTLDHPNIQKTYDYLFTDKKTDDDGTVTVTVEVVSELCEGGELQQLVEDNERQRVGFNERDAKIIMRQLLNAMQYMHSRGICHRDLKPENILLKTKERIGDIRIIDFGFAKELQKLGCVQLMCLALDMEVEDDSWQQALDRGETTVLDIVKEFIGSSRQYNFNVDSFIDTLYQLLKYRWPTGYELSLVQRSIDENNFYTHVANVISTGIGATSRQRTGTLLGTIKYMPPEIRDQWGDVRHYDYSGMKADMWSVGVICYALLHSVPPYAEGATSQSVQNAANDYNIYISAAAKAFLDKLLEHDPDYRYTVEQALEDDWIKKGEDESMHVKLEDGPWRSVNGPQHEYLTLKSLALPAAAEHRMYEVKRRLYWYYAPVPKNYIDRLLHERKKWHKVQSPTKAPRMSTKADHECVDAENDGDHIWVYQLTDEPTNYLAVLSQTRKYKMTVEYIREQFKHGRFTLVPESEPTLSPSLPDISQIAALE